MCQARYHPLGALHRWISASAVRAWEPPSPAQRGISNSPVQETRGTPCKPPLCPDGVAIPGAPERKPAMGLSWQQGPLAPGAIGRFLVPDPLPQRLLYAEPLRRRMRVRFGGAWVADSEDVVLLHEPGRYPVAYFPIGDIAIGVLEFSEHTMRHRDLG